MCEASEGQAEARSHQVPRRLPVAPDLDQKPFPAGHLRAADPDRPSRRPAATEDPGDQPGVDLRREVPDGVSFGQMDPYGGVVAAGRVGDEQEIVTCGETLDVTRAIAEYRTVNRRPEGGGSIHSGQLRGKCGRFGDARWRARLPYLNIVLVDPPSLNRLGEMSGRASRPRYGLADVTPGETLRIR